MSAFRTKVISAIVVSLSILGLFSLHSCTSSSITGGGGGNVPDDGQFYVPNQADMTISIFDANDLSLVKTFNTPVVEPHFIGFAPDGDHYYVVGRQPGGQVAKYDAHTDSLIQLVTVPGGVFPTAFVISANSDTLYLCDFTLGAGHTHRYDISGDNFIWLDSMLQAGIQTHDMSKKSDGSFIVSAGFSSDDMTIVNTITGDVTPLTLDSAKQQFNSVSNNYGPYGVKVDKNGTMALLACRKGVDQLRIVDLVNKTILDSILVPVGNGDAVAGPTLMDISPDNNLVFLTTYTGNKIVVIRLSTREVLKVVDTGIPKPFHIHVGSGGKRIYFTCTNTRPAPGMLYVMDGESFEIIDSVQTGSEPFGLGHKHH